MFLYCAYGMSIASEVELPDLPTSSAEPEVWIRLGTVPRDGRKVNDAEHVMFNNLAGAFHIRNGREIVMDPLESPASPAIRVLLLGRVMAALLRQRGWLPLHASGILLGEEAVLFLGESGAGKSTIAAAFHACGYPVIADDVAPVRMSGKQCEVLAAGGRLRLADDSAALLRNVRVSGKFEIDKRSFELGNSSSRKAIPVRRIFVLTPGEGIRIEVIPRISAVVFLSTYSFGRRRFLATEALKLHVRDCTAIAKAMPVHGLERPMSFDCLPDVVRHVERECGLGG